jgi:predicted unusual protein kinase regulating ubiquinone biosynthesis (AarF/ABC1/UbiB family)
MIYNLFKTVQNLLFIIQTGWIIISEFCLYLYYRNYQEYIKRLAKRLASVNILYVKIFQSIALHVNIIDNTIYNELIQFTDNVPYTEDDIDYDILEDISSEYNLIFKDGFHHPNNSGMISLVYFAEDANTKTNVVVKIKRKNIDKKLVEGISNLICLVNWMKIFTFIHEYKIPELINDNIYIIKEQTNFSKEISNIKRMQKNCRNLNYIKIPKLYDTINENYENVIVMEYINGKKFTEIEKEDYVSFGKQVIKFGIVTTVLHGFSHGDFHIGNVLFIKENDGTYKLGIIDFGIMTEINESFSSKLLICLTSIFQDPPLVFLDNFVNSGIFEPCIIRDVIPKNIYENILENNLCIVEHFLNSKNFNQTSLFKVFKQIYYNLDNNTNKEYKLSRYGIYFSDNFIKIQLSLAMANSVTIMLCQEKIIEITNNVMNELFHIDLFLDE